MESTKGIVKSLPRFGYCVPLFANPGAGLFRTPNFDDLDAREAIALGVYAEELGYDSLWVADHLMLGKDEAVLEGWTVISALGGATSTARLGMIHQAHFFRSPSLAAKMIATLDQITGGRVIVFYDFGRQQREHHAYDLPYPERVEWRVAETLSGLDLMRSLWTAPGPVTFDDGISRVTDAVCKPGPVQTPHPPIWFGEIEDGLLRACARFGQGWNTTPVGLGELGRRMDLLRTACDVENRPFAEIEVSVELQVLVAPEGQVRSTLDGMLAKAPDQSAVDPMLKAYAAGESDELPASFTDITLFGTADQVTEQIHGYIAAGVNHFLLWFLDAPERTGMELFASDIAPKFRTA